MKKTFFSIAMSAVFALSFIFVACNNSKTEVLPTTSQKVRKDKTTKALTAENLANDPAFVAYANLIKGNLQTFANGHYQLSEAQRNTNMARLSYLSSFSELSGSEAEEYVSLMHTSPSDFQNFTSSLRSLIESLRSTFPSLKTATESTVQEVFKDATILAGIEPPVVQSYSSRCADSAYYKAMKGALFCFASAIPVTIVFNWWGVAYSAGCHVNNLQEYSHDLAGC